jgi:hypothetical protein
MPSNVEESNILRILIATDNHLVSLPPGCAAIQPPPAAPLAGT